VGPHMHMAGIGLVAAVGLALATTVGTGPPVVGRIGSRNKARIVSSRSNISTWAWLVLDRSEEGVSMGWSDMS
ncbi:hypothetical protein Tco_1464393, partial [Tanacetum coccineum]